MKKKSTRSIRKYQDGNEVKPRTNFQNDSIIFKRDESLYNKKPSLTLQNKLMDALKKHGPKKLTGKPTYYLSDMVITEGIKDVKRKGGSVKSKKRK